MTAYSNFQPYRPHYARFSSIYLRAFHSPWPGIGQVLTITIRCFITLYMTVTFLVFAWKTRIEEVTALMLMFRFETISFFWQVAYAWVIFTWAMVQFLSPSDATPQAHTFISSLKIAVQQPLNDKRRQLLSIIYTQAVALSNVIALVYWTIVVPNDTIDVEYLLKTGDFQSYGIIILYFISLVVALIEVFFLVTIRPREPLYIHVIWFSAIATGYYVSVFLGHIVTGNYVYFILDPTKIRRENVAVGLLAVISLLNIFYAVAYGRSSVCQ